MQGATDIRSLPTYLLNLYLYPVGAWGIGLAFLFVADRAALAIPLLLLLAVWNGLLTLWWGIRTVRQYRLGNLTRPEIVAAVISIGQLLAFVAATPVIVFMAEDPLAPESWSAATGIAIVSGGTYYGVGLVTRLRSRFANGVALVVAWAALPINVTGSVTLATVAGFYDTVLEQVGLPPFPGFAPDKDDKEGKNGNDGKDRKTDRDR